MAAIKTLLARPAERTYGVITARKDTRNYLVKIGEKSSPARWDGAEPLIVGDLVIVSQASFVTIIINKIGIPGDVTPEEVWIDA